jgi:hypothetical protein
MREFVARTKLERPIRFKSDRFSQIRDIPFSERPIFRRGLAGLTFCARIECPLAESDRDAYPRGNSGRRPAVPFEDKGNVKCHARFGVRWRLGLLSSDGEDGWRQARNGFAGLPFVGRKGVEKGSEMTIDEKGSEMTIDVCLRWWQG